MTLLLRWLFLPGLCLLPGFVAASTTVGIFAILDEVTLEPSEFEPDRIRLAGVFVLPQPVSSGLHLPAQRGHLYFSLNPNQPEQSRADWSALKAAAGSGEVIGFAEYWVARSRADSGRLAPVGVDIIHSSLVVSLNSTEPPVLPEPYPASNSRGVVTTFDADGDVCPRFGKPSPEILAELWAAYAPNRVRPELPVCEARVGLLDASSLDTAFDEQPRVAGWADATEAVLIGRIADAPDLRLTSYTVACRETICHVAFQFPSAEYQEQVGNFLVANALKDVPGFAPGAKINPSFNGEPAIEYWIQRRKPK